MGKSLAVFSVTAILGVSLLLSGRASAAGANGINLTTTPVAATVSAKPGSSVSTILQVQNNAPTAETINVQLETFKAVGSSGAAQMMPFPKGDPAPTWVHFSQTSFVAQPGIWVQVKMTINFPTDAGLGYYYAVVFKPQVSNVNPKIGGLVKGGNAILVLANAVSPNEHPEIQVANFSAGKKLYEYLPVDFSVKLKNSGNIFLPATGDVFISKNSDFTNPLATIPVNASGGNVLPGTERAFTQQWADGFPVFTPKSIAGQKITDKKGQVEEELKWNFADANKLRFGKYNAKLVMVYNDGSRDIPITETVSFWVIPWKILTILLVVVILMLIGLYSGGRKLAAKTAGLSEEGTKEA